MKLILLTVLLSFMAVSHLALLGCYEYHGIEVVSPPTGDFESPVPSDLPNLDAKTPLRTAANVTDDLACPVPPHPLKSIFHMRWFRRAVDVPVAGKSLYIALRQAGPLHGVVLFSAILSTLLEWLLIGSLGLLLVWKLVLKPGIFAVSVLTTLFALFRLSKYLLFAFGHLLPADHRRVLYAVFNQIDELTWKAVSQVALQAASILGLMWGPEGGSDQDL